ncbi:hypothetical protein STEG23_002061, partial [Scotinomys teguina]
CDFQPTSVFQKACTGIERRDVNLPDVVPDQDVSSQLLLLTCLCSAIMDSNPLKL